MEYDNSLDQLLLFGIENTLKLLHILHRLFVCCCNIIVIFISHKPYTTVQRRYTYTIRMLVLGPTEPFNTFIYLVIKKGRVGIILTKIKPVTFFCFSEVWTWISIEKCIGLFCVLEWVEVRGSC